MTRLEVNSPKSRDPQRDAPLLALSIPEFARAHNISVDFYYKLQREGHGPTVMKVGKRTLISLEAAAAWRAKRERAGNNESPPA